MKRLTALALAIALLWPSVGSASALSKAENSSVYLNFDVHFKSLMEQEDGTISEEWKMDIPGCSGYIGYSKGATSVIVTARHCFAPEPITFLGIPVATVEAFPKKVHFFDGDIGTVVSHTESADYDLSIVTVQSRRHHPYAFVSEHFKRADGLFVFGMPNGHFWSYSPATAMQGSATYTNPDWPHAYGMDCSSCAPGDSGAGVWDKSGRVVGILVGQSSAGTAVVMEPGYAISEMLRGYRL